MTYKRPSDEAILEGLEEVDIRVVDLRRACALADEYVQFELAAGNCGKFSENCTLTPQQVDGILYALSHVRDQADILEKLNDKAYGREERKW